ncbi:hypothetical protein CPB84DRAFT_1786630 [Gymnopilus junonius]|uniref:Transmembrane protein n=1 Tax=Gymnopilus junonius TaxID=109634 RepID=A0A9P5NIT0_GYMJU|nr:hypothetical protein CPB84DRAFT_1786630 [Gymnopilus junonius]
MRAGNVVDRVVAVDGGDDDLRFTFCVLHLASCVLFFSSRKPQGILTICFLWGKGLCVAYSLVSSTHVLDGGSFLGYCRTLIIIFFNFLVFGFWFFGGVFGFNLDLMLFSFCTYPVLDIVFKFSVAFAFVFAFVTIYHFDTFAIRLVHMPSHFHTFLIFF